MLCLELGTATVGQRDSRTAGQWPNIPPEPGLQEVLALLRDGLWVLASGSRWMRSLQGCLHRCCFEKQMLLFIKYFASISWGAAERSKVAEPWQCRCSAASSSRCPNAASLAHHPCKLCCP